jgi:ATP-dependent exoDNAse (exonuclease V) beta subunit
VTEGHGRQYAASPEEHSAAAAAVCAALACPVYARPRAARAVRREVPITHAHAGQMIEGIIDLAFLEPAGWVVVDYKTDLGELLATYQTQVELYMAAISAATGLATTGALLVV